jgi:Arc/MetJ-type ribon-helix-helix transcriptional regulator
MDTIWCMRPKLKRVPVGLTETQVERLDQLVGQGIYTDRNEAVRTGVRQLLEKYEPTGCTA